MFSHSSLCLQPRDLQCQLAVLGQFQAHVLASLQQRASIHVASPHEARGQLCTYDTAILPADSKALRLAVYLSTAPSRLPLASASKPSIHPMQASLQITTLLFSGALSLACSPDLCFQMWSIGCGWSPVHQVTFTRSQQSVGKHWWS